MTSPAASAVPPPLCFERGFTLTELAIVMFIVALLIGGMVLPLSAQQDLRQRQETEQTLTEVREALYGFAIANGRLPRPATSATDGTEQVANCTNDADCAGFIPWATLGTKRADAWGKLIRYSVTPAFSSSAAPVAFGTIPNRTVQTRTPAGALAYLAGDAACATASACIPAVVFSQGKLRWGTLDDGSAIPDGSSTNADEDTNNTGPNNHVSRTGTEETIATGGEFDDIVVWISSHTLINRLVSSGKL